MSDEEELYCTVKDVTDYVDIAVDTMANPEVVRRIKAAMRWVNNYMQTTYSDTIPEEIKDATAKYAAGICADYLFTTEEPNQSHQSIRLKKDAKEALELYSRDSYEPESGVEKINGDFFDDGY